MFLKQKALLHSDIGEETVEHYLLECRQYREERKKLRGELGRGKMRMEILLGEPKTIKHTLEFIRETGILERLDR